MFSFSRTALITVIAFSTLAATQVNAFCARCAQIEKQRADEQATSGPQPIQYYDDKYKGEISAITSSDSSSTNSSSRLSPTGSSLNSTGIGGTATNRSALSGSASANTSDGTMNTSPSTEVNVGIPSSTESNNDVNDNDINGDSTINSNSMPASAGKQSSYSGSYTSEKKTYRDSDVKGANTYNTDSSQSRVFSERMTDQRVNANNSTKGSIDVSPNSSSTSVYDNENNVRSENESVVIEPAYSTVFAILQSRDFLKTLKGPFTLFIPSNAAFRNLTNGSVQDLLKPENQDQLSNLVGNHLVAQKVMDLSKNSVIKSVNGQEITVEVRNGVITVNGARILRTENAGTNGVIYIIDGVM